MKEAEGDTLANFHADLRETRVQGQRLMEASREGDVANAIDAAYHAMILAPVPKGIDEKIGKFCMQFFRTPRGEIQNPCSVALENGHHDLVRFFLRVWLLSNIHPQETAWLYREFLPDWARKKRAELCSNDWASSCRGSWKWARRPPRFLGESTEAKALFDAALKGTTLPCMTRACIKVLRSCHCTQMEEYLWRHPTVQWMVHANVIRSENRGITTAPNKSKSKPRDVRLEGQTDSQFLFELVDSDVASEIWETTYDPQFCIDEKPTYRRYELSAYLPDVFAASSDDGSWRQDIGSDFEIEESCAESDWSTDCDWEVVSWASKPSSPK